MNQCWLPISSNPQSPKGNSVRNAPRTNHGINRRITIHNGDKGVLIKCCPKGANRDRLTHVSTAHVPQITPASSECEQSWSPQGACLQSVRELSLPLKKYTYMISRDNPVFLQTNYVPVPQCCRTCNCAGLLSVRRQTLLLPCSD